MAMEKRVVWWVKRDVRLHDNVALTAAVSTGSEVIPLYIEEPLVYFGPDWSPLHTFALHGALDALNKNLRHHGGALFVRTGEACAVLAELHMMLPFTAIYAHAETGLNHTFARDRAVAAWCQERGIRFKEYSTNGVQRGLRQRDDWQSGFLSEMTSQLLPIPRSLSLTVRSKRLAGRLSPVPTLSQTSSLPIVTERVAHEVLQQFLQTRGFGYSGGVSSMLRAPTACSRLSVYLAWGTLSLRTVFQATERRLAALSTDDGARRWRRSLRAFQSRLFWHGHFVQRLEDAVSMEFLPLSAAFQTGLPTISGEAAASRLVAWRTGMTGFPAIDAAMRYYQVTGWLNFRSRAMITSFAVHALRLPWQTILYELAQLMIDYVPGIHVSQVQMQTGVTGINTIRVYSPVKQQIDHDPDAIFIKRWVPELARYTASQISHFAITDLAPYPKPIIDFKVETKLMKDALYAIKKSEIARLEASGIYHKHGSRKHNRRK